VFDSDLCNDKVVFQFKIDILVNFSLSNYTYPYVMHVEINSLYAFSSYAMISERINRVKRGIPVN
jgi:hypothetical protein